MGHPFITQWTNSTHYIITQLNHFNGMIFCPGKNSLSFGDPLHVVPLVGAAVSTPRLARRADLDQLCRFESLGSTAQLLLLVQQGEKMWNPQFSSSTSQFFAGLLIFLGDFSGEIITFFRIKCLGSSPGYGFVGMAIAPWTWTSESGVQCGRSQMGFSDVVSQVIIILVGGLEHFSFFHVLGIMIQID